MSNDHRLIDSIDALQAEFRAANPDRSMTPDGAGAKTGSIAADRALAEAWALAALGLEGTGAESRRWGRSLADQILGLVALTKGASEARETPPAEADLGAVLAKHPKFMQESRRVAAWIAEGRSRAPDGRGAASGPEAGELAAAWRRTLPGLQGLRAWRFLEHLGYPVVAPEAALRRLLWRMGEIPSASEAGDAGGATVTAAGQRLARIAGMNLEKLRLLLRWAARSLPPFHGGHWCGAKPRCSSCPMRGACLWARYHSTESTKELSVAGETAPSVEAWKRRGAEELEDAELLALLLKSGRNWAQAVEEASRLIDRSGGLSGLVRSGVTELQDQRGIGLTRALQIKAALELGRRASMNPLEEGRKITGSEIVWEAFRERFRHIPQEHFIVLLLDTKNRFKAYRIVSRGTLDSSSAHPREVFKEAIRESASAVILMHNHPSGDPEPSPEDRSVTRQLVEAGSILGIRVLDHIILGGTGYFSFRDSGEM